MQTTRPLALALVTVLALAFASCDSSEPEAAPGTVSSNTPTPTPEPTSEQPVANEAVDRTILFQRSGTKRTSLAWVAADGSAEAALLPDFGDLDQTNPDWSPDGTQVVFVMTDGTTDDLFIADAGATEATKLLDCESPCVYIDDPAWSPDGERIAYSRMLDRDGVASYTLETVEVATGRFRIVMGPMTMHGTAGVRWSPNGRKLVFEMVDTTTDEPDAEITGVTLTTYSFRDDSISALTERKLYAATADWSPDGQWIVYCGLAKPGDETTELFRVDKFGARHQQLTHLAQTGGYAAEPTYAADGRILFSGGRTADESEVLLALDGNDVVLATGEVVVSGRHPRVKAAAS